MNSGKFRKFVTWPKLVLSALAGLLWAAWYVPRISADKYREPIHLALESALGRKVEVGRVQFQLLPVPGFTVENVKISEDPSVGPEPVAYISVMRGRPRLSALFGGPLEFASVDLEDTSVNLTRVDSVAGPTGVDTGMVKWNFSELLRPKLLKAFPSVHLISGRVNFKFGDTKSVFYLLNTDVDLWPPSGEGDPWTLKVRAEPARTDRPARGFGFFVARGQWHQADSSVTLDVKMEKSELGDMMTLFEGRESGIHGDIWGAAHLAGPLSRLGIAGSIQVADIHGWNTTPPGGKAVGMTISGALNVPAQTLEVRAVSEEKNPIVDVRYKASDYLKRPRWDVRLLLDKMPIAPLFTVARNIGWGIPAEVAMDGVLSGQLGFSMPDGNPVFDGQLATSNVAVHSDGAPAAGHLRLADASIVGSGSTILATSVTLTADSGETAILQAGYDAAKGQPSASLETTGMPIGVLRPYMSAVRAPFLGVAASGTWAGSIAFSKELDAAWSGSFSLKNADVVFPAFAQPVRVSSAEAALDQNGFALKKLVLTVAGMDAQGEFSQESGIGQPQRFRLVATKIDMAQVDQLLAPLLRRAGLLAKALGFGKTPEPDWLKDIHIDGTLQAASVDLAGNSLTKVRTRILWNADGAKLDGLQFQLPDSYSGQAAFKGDVSIDLAKSEPEYSITGKLSGVRWRSTALEADGALTTSGTGEDLLSRVKSTGKLRSRNVELAPLAPMESLESMFQLDFDGRNPRLKLSEIAATWGGAKWSGSAASTTGGIVEMKLSDGKRTLEASGAALKGEPLKGTVR